MSSPTDRSTPDHSSRLSTDCSQTPPDTASRGSADAVADADPSGNGAQAGPRGVQSTFRAIGYTGRGGLTLYSRNDRDISRSYPEIAALKIVHGVVLDGELVALDEHGRPDFGLLQH